MKIFLYLFIFLLFIGCAPVYTKHNASLITFKTPDISFSDAGFVHDDGKAIKVVILLVGQAVFTLEVGRKVCLNGNCLSKRKFVKEKLNAYYPHEILQNIFLAKPIFNAQNLIRQEKGFTQKLYKEGIYDISYSVLNGKVRFKDRLSGILIKSKKIKQEEKK